MLRLVPYLQTGRLLCQCLMAGGFWQTGIEVVLHIEVKGPKQIKFTFQLRAWLGLSLPMRLVQTYLHKGDNAIWISMYCLKSAHLWPQGCYHSQYCSELKCHQCIIDKIKRSTFVSVLIAVDGNGVKKNSAVRLCIIAASQNVHLRLW